MTPSVPDSETVLLRRELAAATRLSDALKAKCAKDTGDMGLEIAGLRGVIDRLNVAAAQHAGCCGDEAEIAGLRGVIDRLNVAAAQHAGCCGDEAEIAGLRGEDEAEIAGLRGVIDRSGAGPRGGKCGAGPRGGKCGAGPRGGKCGAGPRGGKCGAGPRGGKCGAGPRGGKCGGGGRDAAKPGREPAGGGEKDAGAMAAELTDARRRLALCDHHDRADARAYNADRAKFRRENGAHGSDRKPGKIGAPAGHEGASHRHKPERRTVAEIHACECCGSGEHLEPARPAYRIALILGSDGKIAPVGIRAERANCTKCRKISEAKSEAIPGTRPGLALLGIVAAHVAKALTDADIADLMERPRGLKISSSAVKARGAIARILGAAYGRILE